MKRPKILVVGSLVMDQIVTTSVIPHEGQTVIGESFAKAPGGKGANQAVQAARLGAQVTMFGKLGHDANGEEMIKTCREAGIDTSHICYDDRRASGCSMITLLREPDGSTNNRIIVIPGANMTINEADAAFLKDTIRDYDLVMLQLEIPMAINELAARTAYEAGVPVMLNSAPSAPLSDRFLSYLTYISPNEHEAEDMTGVHLRHEGNAINIEDAKKAAEILRGKGVKNVLITLGSGGAVLLNDEGFIHSPCVTGIKVVDPTAAGDSFVGALCTAICCKWDIRDSLVFANHTAALTVSRLGAMPSLPALAEVAQFMKERKAAVPDLSMIEAR